MLAALPTDWIRPFASTTVWSSRTGPPVPSITRTWVKATIAASTDTYCRTAADRVAGVWAMAALLPMARQTPRAATGRMRMRGLAFRSREYPGGSDGVQAASVRRFGTRTADDLSWL